MAHVTVPQHLQNRRGMSHSRMDTGDSLCPSGRPGVYQVLVQGWAPAMGPSLPSINQGKHGLWD